MQAIIDQQREFVAPVAWEKFKRAMAERQIAQENKFASEADSEGLLDALKAKAEFAKFQNGGSYDE